MAGRRSAVHGPDGRRLDVLVEGPPDGFPLLFHWGTPSAAVDIPFLAEPVLSRGWRLVAWSRPGYGESTRHPGRRVADCVPDVEAVLDAVGAGDFVALGWSGGGPHALACAALLPGRCRAAATLAGAAPLAPDGMPFADFLASMGPENVEEFTLAAGSPDALRDWLDVQRAELAGVRGDQVAASLGDLVDHVDRAALTGTFAEVLAASFRRAVLNGVDGWLDDDLAFVAPWGFSVRDISVPVALWQGRHDLMVPFAHGEWLAAHVPGATPHLLDDEGHVSLVGRLPDIVDDLATISGR